MTEERNLRKEIVELLVGLPAVSEPNGRRAILLKSGLDEVLREIDCTGTPSDFATRLVAQLYRFGSLQCGQHALDALLEGLKEYFGLDKQTEIETLRERLRVHLAELEALGLKSQIGMNGDFVSAEEIQNVVCRLLEAIENEFKYVPIFHPPHKIVLQDQYIPIEVTLERRYRHEVETTLSYAEGEAEFAHAYAMKGFDEMQEEMRRLQVSWKEAKQKHKRLIILADPGMGKTALLKLEAVKTAQKSLPDGEKRNESVTLSEVEVPLFFRLSEFVDTAEEIAEAIPHLLQRNYPDTVPTILPLLSEKLKNGKCLLLLDALDEVPQKQRNPLAEKLNRFARNYPCPIIVTSRIVGYDGGILHDAKEVEIVPFSRKQIDQYIEIWFKNLEATSPLLEGEEPGVRSAKGLIHELQQRPQIRGLAQNPLLLSLLCSLYQKDKLTLPARRVQIYEHAIEYMLEKWTRNRNPQKKGRIRAKRHLLEDLAYQLSCEYKEVFTADDLYDKVEAYLRSDSVSSVFKESNSETLIAELTEEDGIIQQLDREGDDYIFLHRTFQEYLTASYLKRQPNGIELAEAHFWDFDWHETLILFAGLTDDPRLFLNTLIAERDDIFHTLLLLAGKCLAECPQLDMPQFIDRLYSVWRLALYREFVEPAVVVVGQTHQRMLAYLLDALHDANEGVMRRAATALEKLGDTRAVEGLLIALHNVNEGFRWRVCEALGEIGDARAVEGLLTALHDTNKTVRYWAAEALGKIGNVRAVDGLLAALHDADRDVKSVATALKKLGDTRAVERLLTALHDTNKTVRYRAAEALGELGGARAVDGLLAALHDADRDVRHRAVLALGKIGDARAMDEILPMLHDTDVIDRMYAAAALGELGDTRAVDGLLTALHDTDVVGRKYAASALGKLGDTRAVEGLLAALHDADGSVRLNAVLALERLGDARAVEGLLAALHNRGLGHAAWALGEIGDIRAVEGLLAALHDTNKTVRYGAASALGELGDTRAVDGLLAAIHDADGSVRRAAAAKALGKIGTLEVLEKLLNRLDIDIHDEAIFPAVRRLAIKFSRLQPPPACLPVYPQPLFLRLLKKGLWRMRILWSEVLPEVLPLLVELLLILSYELLQKVQEIVDKLRQKRQ